MSERPSGKGPCVRRSLTTTPHAAALISLLGGHQHNAITLSRDEIAALERLYGFRRIQHGTAEKCRRCAGAGVEPAPSQRLRSWPGVRPGDVCPKCEGSCMGVPDTRFAQAGSDRNLFRHAEADGLRLVAWLARFLEPGADPLKMLVRLAADVGFDVDHEDVAWADEDYGDDAEDAEDAEDSLMPSVST